MNRNIIYMPAQLTTSGHTEFFRGFTFRHPGTKPHGMLHAEFDRSNTLLLSDEKLTDTINDLQKMNVTGYKVQQVAFS